MNKPEKQTVDHTDEQTKQQLEQYAIQLNALHGDIQSNDRLSIHHGKLALGLGLEAGELLCQCKKMVPHKEWEKWIAANVNGIGLRTCQNYMALYRKTKVVSFSDVETLNEAYHKAGILKTPAKKKSSDTVTPETFKLLFPDEYRNRITEMVDAVLRRVHGDLRESKVNWHLSEWEITNGEPFCQDNDINSRFPMIIAKFQSMVVNRQYSDVTPQDEIEVKTAIISKVLFTAIIEANTPEPIAERNRLLLPEITSTVTAE